MKRKILPYNPALKILAKKLREEMTMCEVILWNELKQKKLGVDFDRQRPIDNYIVDFYCKDLMLAIEVDGATHYTEIGVEKDLTRQEKIEKLGVRFLRFDDDEVKTNLNGVLEIIRNWIEAHPQLVGRVELQNVDSTKETSHPPPDPSKEGSKVPRRKRERLFHFKKFSVRHDRSGMKVGTDGVLLGAWADVTGVNRILDIGAGTGVIALMLAQRTEALVKIEAVEMDEHAYDDMVENFQASPWKEKLIAHHSSIQNFHSLFQFDLIVSNPPYFQNSFKPTDQKRLNARHTESLQFNDLLNASDKFLSSTGRLAIILPFSEGLEFISLANQRGYTCSRKWRFKSRMHKPVERWLLEFTQKKVETEERECILHSEGDEWSEDYKNLTKEFYLKL